jgi:hypothetical protein
MVQGVFDDLNPETRSRWAYSDTKLWDPERNTREFLAAMPLWRDHGLLAFTINLQGGSPQGYSKGRQIWHNSAITAEGDLCPEYLDRLDRKDTHRALNRDDIVDRVRQSCTERKLLSHGQIDPSMAGLGTNVRSAAFACPFITAGSSASG